MLNKILDSYLLYYTKQRIIYFKIKINVKILNNINKHN